jgi:hypothetical protein
MDPLKIDVGAEIIDLVKRLGAPPPPHQAARQAARSTGRHREPVRAAPAPESPEPPEAA